MPDWVWSEAVLTGVARALREWHDASASFDLSDAVWDLPARSPLEVVCHTDFAPYNCVFRDARFAGAIDFDLCAPGPRIWDIAYTTYRFVPLMPPRDALDFDGAGERSPFSPAEARARLEIFLDAYSAAGAVLRYERAAVLAATVERLHAIADWVQKFVQKTGSKEMAGHAEMYTAHAGWLSAQP
jgi:Ser/Thr protein kinase RdoA (MazF antagonist)